MYILRADTGQAIEVNVSPGASVHSLREAIAAIAPIAPQDQILLLSGKRLDSNKSLEYYGLPSKEKEVFLFNRRAIGDPNFPIEESTLPPIETQLPQPRPLSKEFESKPLLHALKTYEHQFHFHYFTAQAIFQAFQNRLHACKMCFSEIHVQVRGIECAILNLNDHMGSLVHTHEDFIAHVKLQTMESDELLDSFDSDLAKLREVHIHPALSTQGTTLFDCVPESKLRVWAKDGRNDNDHVKMRIPDMENQLRQLQYEVDSEIKKPNEVDLRELSERIFHSEQVLKDMETRTQMFAKDFENVRNRVEFALQKSGQNLGNICDGFDEIAKNHEAILGQLRAQDEASKENLQVFVRCKSKLSRVVYMRIRSVSSYQSRVRELHNTMAVMGEALNRLKAAFAQLAIVKNMPRAYQAAIQEVSRRRGFGKKLRREVARMNEVMAKIRDDEVPKREGFINKYFHCVPRDLVPGLQDPFPSLEVSLPPIDTNLPQIDADSTSGEEDDFTIVPFGDEPMPRLQSFDRDNAFSSQSGSNNYTTNPNPTTPYHPSPNINPTGLPPSHAPLPSHHTSPIPPSNPIPITSTKGFATPVHTSSGPLSVSPGSDVLKLQKDLAAAKEVSANYAERIKHLEGELNKLYKEKVELTQQKLDSAHISGSRFEVEMRSLLTSKEDTIRALKAELDSMREKEQREREPDPETEALRSKVFEQEHQIERLMTALRTTSDPLVVSARQGGAQLQEMEAEVKRLLGELEEAKAREKVWEVEKQEASEKYEGMMKQLTGELEHLRLEKLHTSRSWNNEKMELDKAQKLMDGLKQDFAQEKLELENAIKKLQDTTKQQAEAWERDRADLEKQSRENQEAAESNKQQLLQEQERILAEMDALNKEHGVKEADLQRALVEAQSALDQSRKEYDKFKLETQQLQEDIEARVRTLNEKNATLSDALAESKAVAQHNDQTAKKLASDLSAVTSKLEEVQRGYNNLKAQKGELEQSLEAAKLEKRDLSEKLAHTMKTLAQEGENLNSSMRAKDAALTDSAASLKAISAKLKEKEEEVGKMEVALRKVTKDLQDSQAALQAKEKELIEAQKAIRDRDDRIAGAENTIKEKDAALRASEEALRSSEEALRAKEAALQEKELALRDRETVLREKDEELAKGEEMSKSVANLSQLLETKEKEKNEGVIDYERKLMEMEERQKQIEMDRYRTFELEREDLELEHNKKVVLLQQQITELENELKKQDKTAGPQLVALTKETSELKRTATDLQTQLKELGAAHLRELDGITQKHAKKEAEIGEISVQIQKKNTALEKRLQDMDEEKKRIQEQLDQFVAAQNKVNQIRQLVTELSSNLKNHPACANLEDKGGDEFTLFQTRVSAVIAYAHNLEEERDHAQVAHMSEAAQLRTLLQTKEDRVGELERRLTDAKNHLAAWEMSQAESVPNKISFSKFKAGDIALFLPKNKSHEAFNINFPNYYLSQDCAALYENQTYVCGQIIEIDSRKATARDNPFRLPDGTEFHEVTVTSI